MTKNLRQKRTHKYNKHLDDIWSERLKKYNGNPILKKIDLNNVEHIDFSILNQPHINYGNQVYNFYYFYKVNKFVLGSDDENNDLEMIDNFASFYNLIQQVKKEKLDFYNSNYRKYLATYKIQQWWKLNLYDPNKKFLKNYLNKEYDNYSNYSNKKLKLNNDF